MVSLHINLICSPITNRFMKSILSEKNLVVVLFVMVLITFSLAQEDSKKMEKLYSGGTTATAASEILKQDEIKSTTPAPLTVSPVQ